MILCLYIEVKDEANRARLEADLRALRYAFYDATHLNNLTMKNNYQTLEDIETFLENK